MTPFSGNGGCGDEDCVLDNAGVFNGGHLSLSDFMPWFGTLSNLLVCRALRSPDELECGRRRPLDSSALVVDYLPLKSKQGTCRRLMLAFLW